MRGIFSYFKRRIAHASKPTEPATVQSTPHSEPLAPFTPATLIPYKPLDPLDDFLNKTNDNQTVWQ